MTKTIKGIAHVKIIARKCKKGVIHFFGSDADFDKVLHFAEYEISDLKRDLKTFDKGCFIDMKKVKRGIEIELPEGFHAYYLTFKGEKFLVVEGDCSMYPRVVHCKTLKAEDAYLMYLMLDELGIEYTDEEIAKLEEVMYGA